MALAPVAEGAAEGGMPREDAAACVVDMARGALCSAPSVAFEEIEESDTTPLRLLHEQCFPVHYDGAFYADVGHRVYSGKPLITLVARRRAKRPRSPSLGESAEPPELRPLVGAITAQVRVLSHSDGEQPMLATESTRAGYLRGCYILTLATDPSTRRQGVGSALLEHVVAAAAADPGCGVVYLHVITYNEGAIRFYERHGFRRLSTVEGFYKIKGVLYDAHLYARFLGSARPAPRASSVWQSIVEAVSTLLAAFRLT